MRIIIASNSDAIAEYLINAGHEVKSLFTNDLTIQVIEEFPCDLVIYFSTVNPVIPHQEAITTINKNGIRIIFVAPPDDPLIFFVAALGNSDILLHPITREALLDRINNPLSSAETAQFVFKHKQQLIKATVTETDEINNVDNKNTSQPFLKKIFTKVKGLKDKNNLPTINNKNNEPDCQNNDFQYNITDFYNQNYDNEQYNNDSNENDSFFAESVTTVEIDKQKTEKESTSIIQEQEYIQKQDQPEKEEFENQSQLKKNTAFNNIPSYETKILAISAPWISSGVSVFTSILAKYLSQDYKTAVVDCDLSGKGLGIRLGLQDMSTDWRYGRPPVVLSSNLIVYPLSPALDMATNENQMLDVIAQAGTDTEWLIIDAGTNPDTWWFKSAVKKAGLVLWVIKDDPLLIGQAALRWPNRPKVMCREIITLYGTGDTKSIESIFMLPCGRVKGIDDKKGVKKLIEIITTIPIKNGPRILTVGFNVPDVPGIVCDSFKNVDEAIYWVQKNRPDAAVVVSGLKKISLLEFDLKKYDIPVYKIDNPDLFLEVIKEVF